MYGNLKGELEQKLADIRSEGLYKQERVLATPQGPVVRVAGGPVGGKEVLNFCANNYLGLAEEPSVREAAARAAEEWGYGLASVRFICGTQSPHKRLERAIADFLARRTRSCSRPASTPTAASSSLCSTRIARSSLIVSTTPRS